MHNLEVGAHNLFDWGTEVLSKKFNVQDNRLISVGNLSYKYCDCEWVSHMKRYI